jgi:hypothetical protein
MTTSPLILAICEQITKAKGPESSRVVTHMSAGMAENFAMALNQADDESRIRTIQLMDHSTLVDLSDKTEWCVTFKR